MLNKDCGRPGTPPIRALIRDKPVVNSPLVRPYFFEGGGVGRGVPLDSHDNNRVWDKSSLLKRTHAASGPFSDDSRGEACFNVFLNMRYYNLYLRQ